MFWTLGNSSVIRPAARVPRAGDKPLNVNFKVKYNRDNSLTRVSMIRPTIRWTSFIKFPPELQFAAAPVVLLVLSFAFQIVVL